MNRICIIGSSGFALEVLSEVKMVYDYFKDRDFKVIPPGEQLHKDAQCLCAIGKPEIRERISNREKNKFLRFISIDAHLDESSEIGEGTMLLHKSIVTVNCKIGKHCIINLNSTVGHNCKIGDFVTIAPGVNISGNVTIGNRCEIGTNTAIRQGVTICDDVIIGMGSVVLNDIKEPGTYYGLI